MNVKTGCICEYIFWTKTYQVTKLGQLIDLSKGNTFHKSSGQSLNIVKLEIYNLAVWCNYDTKAITRVLKDIIIKKGRLCDIPKFAKNWLL